MFPSRLLGNFNDEVYSVQILLINSSAIGSIADTESLSADGVYLWRKMVLIMSVDIERWIYLI